MKTTMSKFLIFSALCLCYFALAEDGSKVEWKDCGKPGDHGKFLGVSVTPNPLKKGQKFTAVVNLTLDEDVTGGKLDTVIHYGLYDFHQVYSLCDSIGLIGLSCPLQKGTVHFNYVGTDVNTAPKGTFRLHGEIIDQNGERVLCADLILPL